MKFGIPRVEINDDVVVRGYFLDAREHRTRGVAQMEILGIRAEYVDVPAVVFEFGRNAGAAIHGHCPKFRQRLSAVITRRDDLQHQLPQRQRRIRIAA